MENYLGVMYRIDAGIKEHCWASGEDKGWRNEDGDVLSFCEVGEMALEEIGYELVKKVLGDEYKIEGKREFDRCFEDYCKLARYFIDGGRGYYENKILEFWLDILEAQLNKEEYERQENELLDKEEGDEIK
jgi:hypothetical protein